MEEINKIQRVYKEKTQCYRKWKINRINELEEDLRIETAKRRPMYKPLSFKVKNKEIARRKIIELEIEIKSEIIVKTGE